MAHLKANSILFFNDNQLYNVRKAVGYEDVNKLRQDIEHLKAWISMQNHFTCKEFEESYLERLLINNKGSIERTKQKIDKLCTYTNLMPEFLQNFDIKNEFQHLFNVGYNCVLPKPTADNYRIIYTGFTGVDDSELQIIDYYRFNIVLTHYRLNIDYCLGCEVIIDLRNLTMATILKTHTNLMVVQKGVKLITETLSQRIKKIHAIGNSTFFEIFKTIATKCFPTKLSQRIIFHSNVASLHNYFTKDQLPKDLGGDYMSIKELNDLVFKELSSDEHIEKVKFFEQIATDETKREAWIFNEEYSGTPGSFKSLTVD